MAIAGEGLRRFEELLDRAEGLRGRLGFEELRELARLYRVTSAELAWLRSTGADPEAVRHRNALCVRAYTRLYVPPAKRSRVSNTFLRTLPETLAATASLQLAAAALLVGFAIVGASLVAENPDRLPLFVPAAMYPADVLDELASSPAARLRFLTREPVPAGVLSIFGAGLFVHNVRVGLLAVASGILAGVPSVLLDAYNGLTLGAFAWIFSRDEAAPVFWAWLVPHAVPELLAVVLCSAGGLGLGLAVLAPGREGRRAAVERAGAHAAALLAAAVPLLVLAALLESFVRQSSLSTAARFAAAATAAGGIVAYVLVVRALARRAPRPDFSWLRPPPAQIAPVSRSAR